MRSVDDAETTFMSRRAAPGRLNAMVAAGLLTLLGLLAAEAFVPAVDGALDWQRALGDRVLQQHALPTTLGAATFTAPDARWIPHEWIFATLWALAARPNLEALFRIGCAVVAFCAVLIDAYRGRAAAPRSNLIALVLVTMAIFPAFGLRAQILGWPLLALVLLALESGPSRSWLVIPIAVIWDNLHASGLIVPAVVFIYGVGRVVTERRREALFSTLLLAAGTALASAATPFGFAYLAFAAAWSINPATSLVSEWQPISVATLPIFIAPLLVVGILVAGECRGARLSWSQRLLSLALFGSALMHVRNIPLFCITVGPWAALALSVILPREAAPAARMSRSDRGLIGLAAASTIFLAFAGARMSNSYPDNVSPAVAELVARHRETRVVCEDSSWCSRFAGTPQIRVFIDGRIDAYPARVFADFRQMVSGDSAPVLAHWKVDAVLARANSALARSLPPTDWQRVDGGATQLFLRV